MEVGPPRLVLLDLLYIHPGGVHTAMDLFLFWKSAIIKHPNLWGIIVLSKKFPPGLSALSYWGWRQRGKGCRRWWRPSRLPPDGCRSLLSCCWWATPSKRPSCPDLLGSTEPNKQTDTLWLYEQDKMIWRQKDYHMLKWWLTMITICWNDHHMLKWWLIMIITWCSSCGVFRVKK